MESSLLWITLLILAVMCGGLIIYAFWPRTQGGRQPFIRRAGVIAAAIIVAGSPALVRFSMMASDRSDEQAARDDAALAAFIARQDNPAKEQPSATAQPAPHPDMALEAVTARLEKKLETSPDDVNGWILLGRSYTALQNWDRARTVFEKTMGKWPGNTDVTVAYGESLMAAADGKVTDEAQKLFDAAASNDPSNVRARYNLALYKFQNDDARQAQADWVSLAKGLPKESPWRQHIQQQLDNASAKLGTPAPRVAGMSASTAHTPSVSRGPTQAQIAAASSMSPQERGAFINSMVDGLKAKLDSNPNDRDGWLRLGRSYGVLGRWNDARDAYETGLKHFPGDQDLAAGLATARSKI